MTVRWLPLTTCWNLVHQARRHRRGEPGPVFCSWFLTGECQLRCDGCIFFERHPRTRPDLDLAGKRVVLARLGEARLPFLFVAGGEPLLSPHVFDVGDEAARLGIFAVLITNGILIDAANAERIARSFRAVVFSIDGLRAGHDRTRGPGTFDKTIAGLLALLSVRGSTPIYVNSVMNRHNMKEVAEFVAAMHSLGIDRVNFQPNCLPPHRPTREEAAEAIEKLGTLMPRYPGFIAGGEPYLRKMLTYFGRDDNREFCGAPSLAQIAVLPDGTVSACCELYLPLGNLLERSLAEMIASNHKQELYQAIDGCPGCCRKDYDLVERYLVRPVKDWTWQDVRSLGEL